MRPRLAALASTALLCTTLFAFPATAFKRTAVGDPLPGFALEAADGQPFELASSRGEKATLVVFWATWNPRSTQLLADLQPLYAEHRTDGLQILAINAEHAEWDPATRDRVAEITAEQELTYPVLIDRDLEVYNTYGVVAMPSTALADGEGTVLQLQEGYPTAARLGLHDQVLRALGLMQPAAVEEEVAVSRARQTDPKVRRKVEMGRLLLKRRRPSRAVKVLDEAIAADPGYAEAYRVLATVLDALKRDDDAAAARAKLAELERPLATAAAEPAPSEAAGAPAAPPDPAAAAKAGAAKPVAAPAVTAPTAPAAR